MAHVSGISFGKQARALAAALAIGAAALSYSATPAAAMDDLCVLEYSDGYFEFFVPGELIFWPGSGTFAQCYENNDGYGNAGWDEGYPSEGPVSIPRGRR